MIEDRSGEVLQFRRSGVAMRTIGFGLVAAAVALFLVSGSFVALILMAAIGAAWVLLFGGTLTVTVDRPQQVLTIERSNPIRPERREIPFGDLAALTVDRRTSQGRPDHRLMLITKSGERVRLLPFGRDVDQARHTGREIAAHVAIDGFQLTDAVVSRGLGSPDPVQVYAAEQQSMGQLTGRVDRAVRWDVSTASFVKMPVGKWTTPDLTVPEGFVVVGQQKDGSLMRGRLLEGFGLRNAASAYDLCDRASLKRGRVERIEGLAGGWGVLASGPAAARRLFQPGVIDALGRWSAQYPVRARTGSPDQHLSPIALFADDRGLTIAILGHLGGERLQRITDLGVELVYALGGPSD